MIRFDSSVWFCVACISFNAAHLGCSSLGADASSDEAREPLGSTEQALAAPGGDAGATSARQFCGGIAAIPCPGAGRCVDDPTDNCDPNRGGADCGGICSCIQNVLCIRGTHFDSDPDVCACVPDQDPCAAVLCQAGTICVAQDGEAKCLPRRRPHHHHHH